MKNLLLLFLFTFSLISCTTSNEPIDAKLIGNSSANNTSSSNTNPTTPNNNGTFKVDIDGITYTASNTVAIKFISTNPQTPQNSYGISGIFNVGGVNKLVGLVFFEVPSNSYYVGGPPVANQGNANINYTPDTSNNTIAYSGLYLIDPFINLGSINVTSNNATTKIINGNFNAKLYLAQSTATANDFKLLTNGTFTNIQYTVQ